MLFNTAGLVLWDYIRSLVYANNLQISGIREIDANCFVLFKTLMLSMKLSNEKQNLDVFFPLYLKLYHSYWDTLGYIC